MVDPAVVLFANDAFYLAFNHRDLAAMDEIWARQTPTACIHPGWHCLIDREEIMQSWSDILGNESAPDISCHGARVLFQGDVTSVICFEQLEEGWLVATNNFIWEDGELRLCHHQASQCLNPPEMNRSDQPTIQ
jgi:hypothetical protein